MNSITLTRVVGTPHYAEFSNGLRIYRPAENKVFVKGEGWNRFVRCIDYDNHFVALNPKFAEMVGSNFAYCSCGSPAVVVGYNVYKHGASPSSGEDITAGEMLVCMQHAQTGHHGDGST